MVIFVPNFCQEKLMKLAGGQSRSTEPYEKILRRDAFQKKCYPLVGLESVGQDRFYATASNFQAPQFDFLLDKGPCDQINSVKDNRRGDEDFPKLNECIHTRTKLYLRFES
jgi:hypothetical protein